MRSRICHEEVEMTRTDEFAKDMRNEFRQNWPELEWTCPWSPGAGHEHVDLVGSVEGKKLILIEAELRRSAPVVNIIKIWRWLDAGGLNMKPIVVQAFSAFYPEGDSRRTAAEFIGSKMAKAHRVRYVPVEFPFKPRIYGKVGAGRRRIHAKALANTIIKKLR
jgi:hypothetical protein